MSISSNILIIDDDSAVRSSISLLLKRAGYAVDSIGHPKLVLEQIETTHPDLILLDLNFTIDTSGRGGMQALKEIKAMRPNIPVILMTGWATVQLAVEGMKLGAKDFIAKPWDNKKLLSSISTILELQKPKSGKLSLRNPVTDFDHIIGQDPSFLEVLAIAKRVSKTDASVLVMGESGTGKELIAEAIHYESQRANHPFVKVNLGGISSSLFESEMFGHKKGAFTDASADRKGRFEMADTGTIFLDEIGDLELGSQVKLLRVLQEQTFEVLGSSQSKRVDIRVVSATNKDLETMIAKGTFREDLFYRINLIKIEIPPLRKRREDIPLLVDFYLKNLKTIYDQPDLRIDREAIDWLKMQEFQGNVRQLKNLIERVVLISQNSKIGLKDFQNQYRNSALIDGSDQLPNVGSISLEEIEVRMIKKALAFHNNKISAAAKSLGLTRSALYRRLEKYNIPHEL
ncbi:MAG: two-component system NtrC family response regulator [Saprospiraceae bacterium]